MQWIRIWTQNQKRRWPTKFWKQTADDKMPWTCVCHTSQQRMLSFGDYKPQKMSHITASSCDELLRQFLHVAGHCELIGVRILGLLNDAAGQNVKLVDLLTSFADTKVAVTGYPCTIENVTFANHINPSRLVAVYHCSSHNLKASRNQLLRSHPYGSRLLKMHEAHFGGQKLRSATTEICWVNPISANSAGHPLRLTHTPACVCCMHKLRLPERRSLNSVSYLPKSSRAVRNWRILTWRMFNKYMRMLFHYSGWSWLHKLIITFDPRVWTHWSTLWWLVLSSMTFSWIARKSWSHELTSMLMKQWWKHLWATSMIGGMTVSIPVKHKRIDWSNHLQKFAVEHERLFYTVALSYSSQATHLILCSLVIKFHLNRVCVFFGTESKQRSPTGLLYLDCSSKLHRSYENIWQASLFQWGHSWRGYTEHLGFSEEERCWERPDILGFSEGL